MVAGSSLSFDGMTLERAIDFSFAALIATAKTWIDGHGIAEAARSDAEPWQERLRGSRTVLYNHAHAVVKPVLMHDRKRCTTRSRLRVIFRVSIKSYASLYCIESSKGPRRSVCRCCVEISSSTASNSLSQHDKHRPKIIGRVNAQVSIIPPSIPAYA